MPNVYSLGIVSLNSVRVLKVRTLYWSPAHDLSSH